MRRDVLVLSLVTLGGCAAKDAPEAAPTLKADARGVTLTPDAPQWKYVELAVAAKGPPLTPLPFPAHVDLDEKRTSSVGAPLAGRVEAVEVRLGARVKAGDRLFSVRSAAFAELDRETEAARAQVEVRQRLVERAHELFELKAAAQKDVLAAEAELKEAVLTLKAAEAKQRSLQVTAVGDNLFWVKAPRAGTVVDLDVFAGQEVTPERDKPLLRLSDLGEVLVVADVPESDVGDLSVGEHVTIRLQGGATTRDGTITYISEVVDPRRRSVEVRVRAVNGDRALRPNAFAEVVVQPDPTQQVVRVPDAAVVTQGERLVVFVSPAPGRLEPRPVLTGRRSGGEVEIRQGLEPGTRFVAKGALLLLNQVELVAEG
ncbi:MAG: efflux RND transporter periplasmic adaptor subunit [Myxococcota bacterium]|jgi:cobalt-zinc-cadmium efflux system membrane fusion protein